MADRCTILYYVLHVLNSVDYGPRGRSHDVLGAGSCCGVHYVQVQVPEPYRTVEGVSRVNYGTHFAFLWKSCVLFGESVLFPPGYKIGSEAKIKPPSDSRSDELTLFIKSFAYSSCLITNLVLTPTSVVSSHSGSNPQWLLTRPLRYSDHHCDS